jgi:4-amino-4-deoxy-L-arabinose transferase-like glycosyltransferase
MPSAMGNCPPRSSGRLATLPLWLWPRCWLGAQASAGQWVSVLAGAAVAPLVYALVRECRPEAEAGSMVAGLLAAVAAQLTLYSIVGMSDAAGLFWATASALLLLRTFRGWQSHWLVLTAVTLTLAIMTRWVYGLLFFPWGIAALLAAREAGLSGRRIATAAATALLIGTVGIGSQFLNSAGGELAHTGDLQVVGWQPANAFKSVTQNTDGIFDYGRPTALYYLRPTFHPAYIFPLLFPFLLLSLLALKNMPPSRAALLLGWPLMIYVFLAGIAWQNWRFPLALFAPLAVLVGLGVDWVWGRVASRWRPWLLVYCAVALLGSGLWAVRDVGNFVRWANHNKEIALSVKAYIPPEATLLAFDLTATVRHYTAVDTHELFVLTEQDLRRIMGEETAVYLLLNPVNVQTQWVGKSPQQNLAWLQTNTILTPIAHYSPYVLYQVTP